MSFGQWYEDQQAESNPDGAGGCWFDTGLGLPLINTEGMQNFSFDSMKQSMEAQMPKKILGMGYQQRFKVSLQEPLTKIGVAMVMDKTMTQNS
jgi:hypothetical protein